MFKPFFGICTGTEKFLGCGNNGAIKTKRLLCQRCDHKFKTNKESTEDEEPSMIDLFNHIWKERKDGKEFIIPENIEKLSLEEYVKLVSKYRICFVTLHPIKNFNIQSFSHCLTKKTWRKFKYDKINIVLVQTFIHTIWEFESREKLSKYVGFKYLIELTQHLKEIYPKN